MTKIITWNVNGLRSVMSKNKLGEKFGTKENKECVLETLIKEHQPDILCLQEIRCNEDLDLSKLNLASHGYNHIYLNSAKIKKGYSGTGIFSKEMSLSVRRNFEGLELEQDDFVFDESLNEEGRLLTLEFDDYYVINSYTPNSKGDLSRLEYRADVWEEAVVAYIQYIKDKTGKGVIYCGDLNVAAEFIDVHNPKSSYGSCGCTALEKECMRILKRECDLVDSFREMNPDGAKYSWFSARCIGARAQNKGWRIDYILASSSIELKEADILSDYFGSDHVPCLLDFECI
jgi:exodeoxyribonuclease-3